MAGYREHISVSGVLGVVYGGVLGYAGQVTIPQAAIVACLTWLAGMLPDLDSQSGRPVRELFSLLGAVVAFGVMRRTIGRGYDAEAAMLAAFGAYGAVRFVAPWFFGKFTVHRGMFHSIPMLIIWGEAVFLLYENPSVKVRLIMAAGVALGFLSHLILDEMYSVEWTGITVRLNQAAGSAVKLFGKGFLANLICYALLGVMTYLTCLELGLIGPPAHLPAPTDWR